MSSILCAKCGYTATANDIKLPISPVPDLLRGDCVASSSEAQVIHDTISTARVHIAQLVGEMARLQGILDELARKRDALESYTAMHLSLVAPVRSLPTEILSEIFLRLKDATTLGEAIKWNSESPRLNKTPLLLGNVCSRWRTVVLSTPSLWASFALTIASDHLECSTALAAMWLARAGTCPLFISLGATSNYDLSMRPFMQGFLLYCERWYDVRLNLPTAFIDNWYPAKNRLPRLHKLFIGKKCGPNDVFASAPRLRHLYMAPSSYTPSDFQLPWSQLQICDMGIKRRSDECLELLRLAPDLEECIIWPYTSSEVSHAPAPISRVHRMQIYQNPIPFLNKLLLPELRELFLDGNDSFPWIATPQLPPLLDQYPLELLSFQCCHRSSAYSKTPLLAPRLRTIKVDYDPREFDMLAFADAIQSRVTLDGVLDSENTSVTKLETVEIRVRHFSCLDPAVRLRLCQLRDIGLKITLLELEPSDR
ncbi:hypothetical protein PILCRDRAFT_670104 [Piloderma croceum F 1598]|uniref:Uncharacterized protein n=1 Tax=Piloderma croceum (strain F 1598) TaxID=765440 RepID=A0A0C3ESM3_PILCF|nr:hypothetical protein PILCRDRAFT_670104 [Piloderma croceum F 1598]